MNYTVVLDYNAEQIVTFPSTSSSGTDEKTLHVSPEDTITFQSFGRHATVVLNDYQSFTNVGEFRLRPHEETGDSFVVQIDAYPRRGERHQVFFSPDPSAADSEGDDDDDDGSQTPTYVIFDVE